MLAIPHLLWIFFWGTIAALIVIIAWFATLIAGRNPEGLHDFLAGFVRYALSLQAYLFLAANPYPAFFLGTARPYPIDLEIDPPARQSRLTTLFRLFLALPALLLLGALSGGSGGLRLSGGGVAAIGAFLTWFAALVTGRAPRGLRDLTAWGLSYSAQVWGYLFLLTDRYPNSSPALHLARLEPPEAPHLTRLVVEDDLRRPRLMVFFRLPLAVPHLIWLTGWFVLALLAGLLNWLLTLVRGRAWRPLVRFLAAYVRYSTHVSAFLYLTGNPFPGFVGRAGSYPIDLDIALAERQNRWKTLFRLPLTVPALLVSSGLSFVQLVCAFLGWFSALALGRMPEGMRDAGAHSLRYSGQLAAYLFVLTDRYPHGSPLAGTPVKTDATPPLDWGEPGAFV